MGGGKYQRLNHKSLRMPEEDGAFDVHHPYSQMRNQTHRWEVMAPGEMAVIQTAVFILIAGCNSALNSKGQSHVGDFPM